MLTCCEARSTPLRGTTGVWASTPKILERDLELMQSPRIGRHVDEWAKTLTVDQDVLETRRCRAFGEDFDITSNVSWPDDDTSIPDEF